MAKEVQRPYFPGIAYILVTYKTNTRLYSLTGSGAENPAPGLIVDDKVTLHQRYDFFLVSRYGGQSASQPTYYNIVEDTTRITPDAHQQLAYLLTHAYYNSTVSFFVD